MACIICSGSGSVEGGLGYGSERFTSPRELAEQAERLVNLANDGLRIRHTGNDDLVLLLLAVLGFIIFTYVRPGYRFDLGVKM